MSHRLDDTIAAIATAPGEGGLCVVRISGRASLEVADRVFRGKMRPSRCPTHTIHYGRIVEPGSGESVDEVLLSVLRGPRTYTCEDTVEISGHGGVQPGRRILMSVLKNGARLADPGEFTKRAFLNGRIDLVQAEAVADLIRSRTEANARAAIRQLRGGFSQSIRLLRERILHGLALVEVGLDFVEEDIESFTPAYLCDLLSGIAAELEALLDRSRRSRLFQDGIRVAVVGLPNVGKSSILNRLIGWDRAIVDPAPGTTRDTIEVVFDLNGVPVTLIDTAGIRDGSDSVESKGIERTFEEMGMSDFFLWVVDRSKPFDEQCRAVGRRLPADRTLVVFNKADLEDVASPMWNLEESFGLPLMVSAVTLDGFEMLGDSLRRRMVGGDLHFEPDFCINARHIDLLEKCREHLCQAILTLSDDGRHEEIAAVELRCALRCAGDVVGMEIGDDVLDRIFVSFCIGK